MKNKYSRLRELWAVPKYKILMKFGLWFIFFAVIYTMAGINRMKINNNIETTKNETNEKINYSKMKSNFLEGNYNIEYTINDYLITGTIVNDKLEGTLEYNDTITKIKYDGVYLYQIVKKETTINEEILTDINKEYLLPDNIISIINKSVSSANKSEDEKIYSYTVNNTSLTVYLEDNKINEIIILDNGITYTLKYTEI